MRFAPCVLLPSSLMYFMISNSSNCEFLQLVLYICVIIAMFSLGSFIYGDRLLSEFADQPIVSFLFPFLLLTYLWSIRPGSQVKHVTTKPTKPKPKPLKESEFFNYKSSSPESSSDSEMQIPSDESNGIISSDSSDCKKWERKGKNKKKRRVLDKTSISSSSSTEDLAPKSVENSEKDILCLKSSPESSDSRRQISSDSLGSQVSVSSNNNKKGKNRKNRGAKNKNTSSTNSSTENLASKTVENSEKEKGLTSLSHSPPPVKRKQKKKKMSAIKENIDPKVECKAKMVPVLPPYYDVLNHPDFKGKDLYEEFQKYVLTAEELSRYDYPLENPERPGHIFTRMKTYNPSPTSRICSRCSRTYTIENDVYRSDTNCFFHSERKDQQDRFGCCGKSASDMGCKLGISHVNPALPLEDLIFKKTEHKKQVKADQMRKIFGLDCEMVYTTLGFEVAKVTLVDIQGKPVYDTLVLPQHKVTDYNTVYSGIKKQDLKDVKITLDDVQAFLLKNITKDTILVGHALQNDLKCLRIIHEKVVDTQVVFRNPGDNRRKKLKTLASVYLNQSIQDGKDGHCSLQDARACMELMLKKIYDRLDVPLIRELKESEPCAPRNIPDKDLPRRKESPFYSPNPDTNRCNHTNAVAPNILIPIYCPTYVVSNRYVPVIETVDSRAYNVIRQGTDRDWCHSGSNIGSVC